MCLTTKKANCFRYAKKDIICYKIMYVLNMDDYSLSNEIKNSIITKSGTYIEFDESDLTKTDDGKRLFLTPYREVLINGDIINGKIPMRAEGKCHTFFVGNERCIDSGYIHTFSYYPHSWLENLDDKEVYRVFKCIIPKGTRYAAGVFNGRGYFGSYASKQIKFLYEVTE